MKNNRQIKLIAASVALMTSFSVFAGLGGLNVQSNLGEPFSGTIVVTGDEAKALLNGGKASLSNGNLHSSVKKSGKNAVVSIRSNNPIQDPVLIFQMGVGSQARQYTAIIDPKGYSASSSSSTSRAAAAPATSPVGGVKFDRASARKRIEKALAGSKDTSSAKVKEEASAKATKKDNSNKAKKELASRKVEAVSQPNRKPLKQRDGKYVVRSGENLIGIASRVRPNGLSSYETMRALVAANPDIFKNKANTADQIWPGDVIRIPSAAELKRLAASAGAAVATNTATSAQEATSAKPQVEQPVENAPVTTVEQSAQIPEPAAQPAPIAESSAPAETAAAAKASASFETAVAASEATTSEAEEVMASDAEQAVQAASAEVAPTTPAVEEAASREESSGLWRWLLLGGLGVILLWLLSKLLGRKKTVVFKDESDVSAVAEEELSPFDTKPVAPLAVEEDDVIVEESTIRTHQPVARPSNTAPMTRAEAAATMNASKAAASKPKVAVPAAVADDELAVEDDFEDDIFFTEVSKAEPASTTEEGLTLDLGAIDKQQSGILSGAVTRDEETLKRKDVDWDKIESTESVYEPDEPVFNHVAVTLEENKADEPFAFEAEKNSDEGVQAAEVGAVAATAAAAAWTLNDSKTVVAEAEFESKAEELDLLEFDMPSSSAVVESSPVAEEKEEAEEAPAVEAVSDDEWLNLNNNSDISFKDSEDLTVGNVQAADENEVIEWDSVSVGDSVGDSSREGSGFISESVGMTAPLEAKYELAKMYVEIGDPEAARETLEELLEESDGAIQAKARTMLDKLNA